MDTRVIICRRRDFTDKDFCFHQLNRLLSYYKNIEIVSGHAKGADIFGEEYAKENGLNVSVFKPDWKQYDRAAGPSGTVRCSNMLKKQDLLSLPSGTAKARAPRIRLSSRRKPVRKCIL